MTAPDAWDSEAYKDARRCRSVVESLMFTIKDGFAFGDAAGEEPGTPGNGGQECFRGGEAG
jgi:hypothetical protein